MKKSYQYLVIGGIALILVFIYLRKKAAILAVDATRPKGGGGGGAGVAEGQKVLADFQQCLNSGIPRAQCQDMIPL